MKREHGLWYVKYCGVWMVAGKDIGEALHYKVRVDACGGILRKI